MRLLVATVAALAGVAGVLSTVPAQNADASVKYYLPFPSGMSVKVSQGNFGSFSHQGQHAWDFSVPEGTAINAARGGTVLVSTDNSWPEGNYVLVEHTGGICTLYAHLSSRAVEVGEWVNVGERVGYSGNTGYSTAPHLHYQVSYCESGKTIPSSFYEGVPKTGDVVTAY